MIKPIKKNTVRQIFNTWLRNDAIRLLDCEKEAVRYLPQLEALNLITVVETLLKAEGKPVTLYRVYVNPSAKTEFFQAYQGLPASLYDRSFGNAALWKLYEIQPYEGIANWEVCDWLKEEDIPFHAMPLLVYAWYPALEPDLVDNVVAGFAACTCKAKVMKSDIRATVLAVWGERHDDSHPSH